MILYIFFFHIINTHFRWVNRRDPRWPRLTTGFGFIMFTAIAHQGTTEEVTYLSSRILLIATLLAGRL